MSFYLTPNPMNPGSTTTKSLDCICREHTAFNSFAALINALGNYRPTIQVHAHADLAILADEYDAAQTARGDSRRAFRSQAR